MTDKVKVAFVCVHNACRSQMADWMAWQKILAEKGFGIYISGGRLSSK